MTALAQVFREMMSRVSALWPAFSVLAAAGLIYAIFYPQPYLNEALRDVPMAVVDQDGTQSSRELARRIDATPDISAAIVLPDLPTAEREVYARRISGVLLIPKDFERELMYGRAAPIALYADASYFLMYQRVVGGVSAVACTFGAEIETARLIGAGVDPAIAGAVIDPMPLTAVPLFNPQGGYATYVLPAAFVLILQQTLLIAVGLIGTLPAGGSARTAAGAGAAGPVATVLGRLLACLALEALILPFYLIALPYLYGLPRLGSIATILVFALPFILSVGGLGLVVAALFRTPLVVQLVMASIGLPFFFLAGFAWPSEALPQAVRLMAQFVPSTSAIDGLVRVGQLGASLADVRGPFLTLCGLAIGYGCAAVLLEARKRRSKVPVLARCHDEAP
jgi:ABC-2 type transport system permease protein